MAFLRSLAAISLVLFTSTADAAPEVRIRGSTTVAYGLIYPEKKAIEEKTGAKLQVLPSSTTHGLTDLAEGRADIAMLAEPLATIAPIINANHPGMVDISDYQDSFIGNANVLFIVHPDNPIRKLTRAQLADLFSGKIKNWSELGGHDRPVLLVGEPTSTPHRMIREVLGIAYAPDLRVVQNTNQTAIVVAQAPGGFSYFTDRHKLPAGVEVARVATDVELQLPLHLVRRRDASDEVKLVVETAASLWVQ